jgi:hypothetical protein
MSARSKRSVRPPLRIKGAGRGKRSMAARADKHELYEQAVQDPQTEVAMVARSYRRIRKKDARSLREDFCGTAVFSVEWAKSHPKREAWGLDLDRPTLDWGLAKRVEPAGEEVASRVHLSCKNVLEGLSRKVDVCCAFNFSYWIFHRREQVIEYFKAVHRGLEKDGLFFLDAMGGTEVPQSDENKREEEGFVYSWEHLSFDALTSNLRCAIHFEFDDGSAIENAFYYDWRLWSLPEVKEMLLEAGFSKVRFLWEREDEDGDGTGSYYEPKRVDNEGLWWAYIVGEA